MPYVYVYYLIRLCYNNYHVSVDLFLFSTPIALLYHTIPLITIAYNGIENIIILILIINMYISLFDTPKLNRNTRNPTIKNGAEL